MAGSVSVPAIETRWSTADEEALAHDGQRTPALFKKLYLLWVDAIFKYLLHQVGDQSIAEDMTSQVFLKAFEQLPRYKHRGHFAAWLFTIARNSARDHYRRSPREVPIETAEVPAAASDLLDGIVAADEISRLDRLIRALPEDELELIRLRYVAGLSYAEIGAMLHRSEEATRKAIFRLLGRLRGQMGGSNG
jgi:RNA polymerase sigma-70 factor (ECF subfamily)